MSGSSFPRIDGIVAREAPVAVVFRRGPSKLTQQLIWNLETDEVTPGQWIRGRVYTRRCDLSPNGQYLVGAFTNYSSNVEHRRRLGKTQWSHHGWTAVSKVPYYTAVALWFSGGAWNGGGIWLSDTHLKLNNTYGWEVSVLAPNRIRIEHLNLPTSEDSFIFELLLAQRGWKQVQKHESQLLNPDWVEHAKHLDDQLENLDELLRSKQSLSELFDRCTPRYVTTRDGRWVKPFARGFFERVQRQNDELWSIRSNDGLARLQFEMPQFGSQWIDVDHSGRVIFGHEGCLWAWSTFPDGEPTMIADLRENRFEPVAPPEWATRW